MVDDKSDVEKIPWVILRKELENQAGIFGSSTESRDNGAALIEYCNLPNILDSFLYSSSFFDWLKTYITTETKEIVLQSIVSIVKQR